MIDILVVFGGIILAGVIIALLMTQKMSDTISDLIMALFTGRKPKK